MVKRCAFHHVCNTRRREHLYRFTYWSLCIVSTVVWLISRRHIVTVSCDPKKLNDAYQVHRTPLGCLFAIIIVIHIVASFILPVVVTVGLILDCILSNVVIMLTQKTLQVEEVELTREQQYKAKKKKSIDFVWDFIRPMPTLSFNYLFTSLFRPLLDCHHRTSLVDGVVFINIDITSRAVAVTVRYRCRPTVIVASPHCHPRRLISTLHFNLFFTWPFVHCACSLLIYKSNYPTH